jgi:gamma-glutamylcyclotransferase (GGCT)/AIG2-like uncharacterized protein YtfP
MLNFAYGSNMDWAQLRQRCPSAKFVAVGLLPAHRLDFTRKSKNRGCGVADVVVDETESVWGAVFEIPETEVGFLDHAEGYQPGRSREKNSYVREDRHVFREGDKSQPLLVSIYSGIPQKDPPLPNPEYKALILSGAQRWKLPAEYIRKLEAIKTA